MKNKILNVILIGYIIVLIWLLLVPNVRSVYKELHADHETGAADNK